VLDNGKNGKRVVGAAVSYHEVPRNGRSGGREGLPGASASYQELVNMEGWVGLPGASASYNEMAEMGEGEGRLGASASCQEMAEMEGDMGLPLSTRKGQKWGEGRSY
jgi:hypothetical protein